jgi:hypothetical protein
VKRSAVFAAACLGTVAVLAGVLLFVFRDPGERRAVMIGAAIAVAVQLAAFAVARAFVRRNVMAGWGLGIAVRFVAFAVWALVLVGWLGLPDSAALLSMACYLFVTTLIEPFFLKT